MKMIKNLFEETKDKPVGQVIVNWSSIPEPSPEALDSALRLLLETAVTFAETIALGCRVMSFDELDTREFQHPHIHIIHKNPRS